MARKCFWPDCDKEVYWNKLSAGTWRLDHVDGTNLHGAKVTSVKKRWWEFWK